MITEIFFQFLTYNWKKNSVITEKKIQLVHNWIFIPVWNECRNGYFKKPVEIGGKADSLWTAPNSQNWRKNIHWNAISFLGILWILRNISLLHSICTWTSSTYSFSFWGSLEALIITKKDKVWIKGAFRPKLPVFIVCTSLICTYVGNMLTHWQGMFIFLNLKR